jgi:hypothetical protein
MNRVVSVSSESKESTVRKMVVWCDGTDERDQQTMTVCGEP